MADISFSHSDIGADDTCHDSCNVMTARFEDPYKERFFCWLTPEGVLYMVALSPGRIFRVKHWHGKRCRAWLRGLDDHSRLPMPCQEPARLVIAQVRSRRSKHKGSICCTGRSPQRETRPNSAFGAASSSSRSPQFPLSATHGMSW
jgi:hypothetical protein